ncbi:hypothetical protein [Draconibacterium mangrovi]|uniref:hypothetical protein n=1 Tax=Draconibacterium mangrovi TaxID=2697469 RepID=UPI0013D5017E|nr:hypothetical protein [Draconibacterium mangrovi]
MADSNCADCTLRAKYDENPKSFAGRFWRWHINWCPGWKGYMKSLDEAEREVIKVKYHLKKG